MRLFQVRRRVFVLAVGCLVVAGGTIGCQTQHLRARSLPPSLRAASMVGKQRMHLSGMMASSQQSSVIGTNDLIEVSIATGFSGDDVALRQMRVAADGTIDTPPIGRVSVLGLEASAAADQIAAASVARGIYMRPQVNVVVRERATHQITVLGAVDEPGVKELPRSECNLLAALATAGGFAEDAGTTVEVLRSPGSPLAAAEPTGSTDSGVQTVSFDAPTEPKVSAQRAAELIDLSNPAGLPPEKLSLSDRDIVVVRPKEKRVIHVTGLVKSPSQFELVDEQDSRVLDAIAMAGGITTPIADKVLVVRQLEGANQPVVIQVSISRAKTDGDENLVLQANDLVSVESTAATVALNTFQNLFRITMGVGGNLTLF